MAIHQLLYKAPPRDVTKPLPICMHCERRPATRGLESHALRFRQVLCTLCTIAETRWLLSQGATDINTFAIGAPSLLHPDLPVMADDDLRPVIASIDLIELATALVTGALGDHRVPVQDRSVLMALMVEQLDARGVLDISERQTMDVEFAASLALSAERERKRAALETTQQALHEPLWRLAGSR